MGDRSTFLEFLKKLDGFLAVETSPGKFEEVREFPAEPEIIPAPEREIINDFARLSAYTVEELEFAGFSRDEAMDIYIATLNK